VPDGSRRTPAAHGAANVLLTMRELGVSAPEATS
jgi:hypothetical protein